MKKIAPAFLGLIIVIWGAVNDEPTVMAFGLLLIALQMTNTIGE